jgi:hypothetical protein
MPQASTRLGDGLKMRSTSNFCAACNNGDIHLNASDTDTWPRTRSHYWLGFGDHCPSALHCFLFVRGKSTLKYCPDLVARPMAILCFCLKIFTQRLSTRLGQTIRIVYPLHVPQPHLPDFQENHLPSTAASSPVLHVHRIIAVFLPSSDRSGSPRRLLCIDSRSEKHRNSFRIRNNSIHFNKIYVTPVTI